ncbi:MAG: hypothetical protein E3J78_06915 [Candidatus Cloacimonadota bacterium]|nr:MAG: hypothetical protein E3J78_06915 [Candidatus Cloacimonadota bacterium]
MKYKIMIILLIGFLLASCAKNLQQTPQSCIEEFFENVKKLNEKSPITIDQATKILKTLFSTEKAFGAFTTTFRNIEIEEYIIGSTEASGSSAEISVVLKTKGLIGLAKEEQRTIVFDMEKKDGKWYIRDIEGILEKFEKKPTTEKPENEEAEK